MFQIIRTLDKVLRNKPPLPDTLGLSKPLRKELCGRLYTGYSDQAKHDWQALAGEIGRMQILYLSHTEKQISLAILFLALSGSTSNKIVLYSFSKKIIHCFFEP